MNFLVLLIEQGQKNGVLCEEKKIDFSKEREREREGGGGGEKEGNEG